MSTYTYKLKYHNINDILLIDNNKLINDNNEQ